MGESWRARCGDWEEGGVGRDGKETEGRGRSPSGAILPREEREFRVEQ